jgi:L-cysteine/cystine lyase
VTFEKARAAFPVLERYAYLNAGSVGPLARKTYDAVVEAEKDELGPRGSIEAFERIMEERRRLREVLARAIGADASRMALTTSTSEGCRIVLAGLGLGPEDEVVTTDAEHFGLLGPLRSSGACVRIAEVRGRAPGDLLAAIVGAVGPRTRLVAVSHVLWIDGHRVPVDELKEAVSTPVLVDGAQSVGAIPASVGELDYYTVSGQKWLCGPTPTGGLYVREPEALRVAGPSYFSQAAYDPDGAFVPREGAARFDQNWIPAAFIAGLEAAIAAAPEWRFDRAREMTDFCRERLAEAGFDVVTAPGQGTLVSFRWEGETTEVVKRLFAQGVVVRDLPGTGLIRASCGYWTNEDDIERLVKGLSAF